MTGAKTKLTYYNIIFVKFLQSGRTPLHRAASVENDKAVEILVKAGANVNVFDKVSYYHTP